LSSPPAAHLLAQRKALYLRSLAFFVFGEKEKKKIIRRGIFFLDGPEAS
jgi:hypothetical protein